MKSNTVRLTDKDINKYQALYKKQFNVELTTKEAQIQGFDLIKLVSEIFIPITKTEFNHLNKNRDTKQ